MYRYPTLMTGVNCTVISLTMVGEPLAIKYGQPKDHGVIHLVIYKLPDRQSCWRSLCYSGSLAMPKQYSKSEIIQMAESAAKDISTFYQQGFVSYGGVTSDTKEPYSEIVAGWILSNLVRFDNIAKITRTSSYRVETHNGICDGNEKTCREEEWIAKELFGEDFDTIGEVFDYQIPLKDTNEDKGVGKIDLVSYDYGDTKNVYLLELKREDNTESLLRCVLEIYTYWKQLDHEKFIADFCIPSGISIVPAVLIFKDGWQYGQLRNKDFQNTNTLIKALGIKIFTMEPKFKITKEN
jgi:hypothetical protein